MAYESTEGKGGETLYVQCAFNVGGDECLANTECDPQGPIPHRRPIEEIVTILREFSVSRAHWQSYRRLQYRCGCKFFLEVCSRQGLCNFFLEVVKKKSC